mmetsp:Transcript_43458/g.52681  ORF Transcript_43458/g.52681 Transcript_43458/m.52681 type:complete len:83 (-) Transcript_43458:64-312(-)
MPMKNFISCATLSYTNKQRVKRDSPELSYYQALMRAMFSSKKETPKRRLSAAASNMKNGSKRRRSSLPRKARRDCQIQMIRM